ncbi:MAG: rod shape-determining protein [Candidatus Harrisonbacteria bacterium CG10_big_fil_rev_8_21_14_0_10_49_15]|uniref:Cell shape-determining protein MreB n=1 Tax=Candidatus Harrisonbacteria bacterium CG10_big_fil_rev_8_21_14_0_10_49_15 TaxID=1974587 RepID=A0A2H0ULP9_9BACT|nr:MAG: rod shape-determining protein [Candidatus Harrisonbacteria bacterium CG10_big_fil_rev_8_21_14_0_10_49_15]
MKNPFSLLRKNVGVDLGTANSLVYLSGRGIVINEPTTVAVNNKTGKVVAVGTEAKNMLGRTPLHITVVRPLLGGVISDFEMAQEMLRQFLRQLANNGPFNYYQNAVIGVPSDLTEVERKSVEDAILGAGVSKAYVIESAVAAALGARLPVTEPVANMIIDIGGGTTEVAIISMGGAVTIKSVKVAGDKFNEDIIKFVKDEFHLAIGEPTAEELKIELGSAVVLSDKLEMLVRGRDLATGLPKEILLKDAHIRSAIGKSLKVIVDAIKDVVEVSPPELVGDLLQRGIHLCGGGSLLRGIDDLISKELAATVTVVDDPLTCVARGTGLAVENLEEYSQILDNPLKPREIKL